MKSKILLLLAAITLPAPIILASDESLPGEIKFASISYAVVENPQSGFAVIEIVRTGGSMGLVNVEYISSDGTATANQDYAAVRGILQFAAGQSNRTFVVPILDDLLAEGNETLLLTLTNATGGAAFPGGARSASASLAIVDNELARGEIGFASATYHVNEKAGLAHITVQRLRGSAGIASVQYYTVNGTAESGPDYVGLTGNLVFSAGQTQRTFTVSVLRDYLVEPDETVRLILTNATGGATLVGGGPSAASTLVILDADTPRLSPPVLRATNAVDLTFEVEPGFRYTVEYSEFLGKGWAPFTNILASTAPYRATVSHSRGAACFYRLRRDPLN